ncbi:MAG: hypothetical protein AB8G05_06920, partial [Oligoflexales bacterium]
MSGFKIAFLIMIVPTILYLMTSSFQSSDSLKGKKMKSQNAIDAAKDAWHMPPDVELKEKVFADATVQDALKEKETEKKGLSIWDEAKSMSKDKMEDYLKGSPPPEKTAKSKEEGKQRGDSKDGNQLADHNDGDTEVKPIQKVIYITKEVPAAPREPKQKRTSSEDVLLAMASEEVRSVTTKGSSNYASDKLLKLGSEYLGVINDAIEVYPSEKPHVVVTVFGKLSPHSVSQPFKLMGEATLSHNGQKVNVSITHCIDPNSNTKGIKCSGEIKGIDGRNGLHGKIYNPSIWASIVKTASTLLSQYSLSSMTSSVTTTGKVLDQSQSNRIYESLS